jgi:putative ABC transport system ATP-binding protein
MATLSEPLLFVRNLKKTFGPNPVLRGVSVDLNQGERLALMGPSGGGKSTLLNCVAGLETPDEGEISFAGKNLKGMSPDDWGRLRKSSMSFVFQFFNLLPTLNAAENIEFPLRLMGLDKNERAGRVNELINAVGLNSRRSSFPNKLSGGEQQRVALARALAPQPRLILADEPTGNLDSRTGDEILTLIQRLTDKFQTSLLMVTHSDEATRICHRTLVLRDGQIVSEGQ